MKPTGKKYATLSLCLSLAAAVATAVSCSTARRSSSGEDERRAPVFERRDTAAVVAQPASGDSTATPPPSRPDSLAMPDSVAKPLPEADSSLLIAPTADSAAALRDTVRTPAARRTPREFLDAPVRGTAQDSLVYDARRRLLFHYKNSEIVYLDNDLKADHIVVNAVTKEVFGAGMADSTGRMTRPEFLQGGANYSMDTVNYNLGSRKGLLRGVATKDGEGFLTGRVMKKQADNTIDMAGGGYTTCERIDHPHFYITMTKAKVVPGKKIIMGPAFFVMEDVRLPFVGLPGGFFPISTGPTAGLMMPRYGEEASRGFFFRDGGYYFTFGDRWDLKLLADIYTLGSWSVKAQSNYIKRYKYNGSFGAAFDKVKVGDYPASNQFKLTWNHTQDPKANPWRTFSANVNFATAGQKQMATTSLNDHLNTSTSSTVQYTRRWDVRGTAVSLSAQMGLNTNSADTTVSVTLPNLSLSVASFAPLKRRSGVGKERWWEKVTVSYAMQAMNQTYDPTPGRKTDRVKEYDFFSMQTLRNMRNGVSHSIPIQTSFNLLNYINFSPSFNYREVWNFKREYQVWNPDAADGNGALEYLPMESGFFRTYNWSVNGSFSTKIYGTYTAKQRPGARPRRLQGMRHTLTPNMSFTYSPDFSHPSYGFLQYVQNSRSGGYTSYNPNQGSPGPLAAAQPSASVSFSLSNRLEIKVADRADSTKKNNVVIIEQLSVGSNYNFLLAGKKDQFPLGMFPISLRSGELFKGFAIQLSGTWDPYSYVQDGEVMRRVNTLAIGGGKFGRLTQTSWSFGKTFNSKDGPAPAPGSMNGAFITPVNNPYDLSNGLDPATRRQYMVQGYYDFRVPWSFTFNYNVGYNYSGTMLKPKISQTLSFNGSVTMGKWGANFTSGYDFTYRKLSHMQLNFTRDLHCWDMSFQWVPMGSIKSYSFHIGIRSGMLRDIKYDKSSNMYDTLMR